MPVPHMYNWKVCRKKKPPALTRLVMQRKMTKRLLMLHLPTHACTCARAIVIPHPRGFWLQRTLDQSFRDPSGAISLQYVCCERPDQRQSNSFLLVCGELLHSNSPRPLLCASWGGCARGFNKADCVGDRHTKRFERTGTGHILAPTLADAFLELSAFFRHVASHFLLTGVHQLPHTDR